MTEVHTPEDASEARERATLILQSGEPSTPDIELMLWPGWFEEIKGTNEEQTKA